MPLNNKINRFIINLPPLYPSGYPLDLGNIENQASRKGIFQNDKRAALKIRDCGTGSRKIPDKIPSRVA